MPGRLGRFPVQGDEAYDIEGFVRCEEIDPVMGDEGEFFPGRLGRGDIDLPIDCQGVYGEDPSSVPVGEIQSQGAFAAGGRADDGELTQRCFHGGIIA